MRWWGAGTCLASSLRESEGNLKQLPAPSGGYSMHSFWYWPFRSSPAWRKCLSLRWDHRLQSTLYSGATDHHWASQWQTGCHFHTSFLPQEKKWGMRRSAEWEKLFSNDRKSWGCNRCLEAWEAHSQLGLFGWVQPPNKTFHSYSNFQLPHILPPCFFQLHSYTHCCPQSITPAPCRTLALCSALGTCHCPHGSLLHPRLLWVHGCHLQLNAMLNATMPSSQGVKVSLVSREETKKNLCIYI